MLRVCSVHVAGALATRSARASDVLRAEGVRVASGSGAQALFYYYFLKANLRYLPRKRVILRPDNYHIKYATYDTGPINRNLPD